MGGRGQKRVALDSNKERFVRKKGFGFVKMGGFWNQQGKACAKESFLYVKRRFLRTVKSCSNKRCFACENERFLRAVRKLSVNGKLLVCENGKLFQLMQSQPIKKSIFQRTTTPTSYRTKANAQLQILSAITYCELAVKQLFFEKYQSCVCTTVTLSHRFKAFTPAFCR